MLAQLIDKPLPGDKQGVDVFYHSRLVVETVLKQLCDWIIPRLRNPKTRGRLEKNLQSSTTFMRRPSVELFLICMAKPFKLLSLRFVK